MFLFVFKDKIGSDGYDQASCRKILQLELECTIWNWNYIIPREALHYHGDEPIKLLYQVNPSFFFRVAWLVGV